MESLVNELLYIWQYISSQFRAAFIYVCCLLNLEFDFEAYNLEPTMPYFILMIFTISTTALLNYFMRNKLRWLEKVDLLHQNIMRSITLFVFIGAFLPPTFETAHIIPHITSGVLVGFGVADLAKIWKKKCSTYMLFLGVAQVLFMILNLFVLSNWIVINIYLKYIQLLEFSKLVRLSIILLNKLLDLKLRKESIHICWCSILANEFYCGCTKYFLYFKSALPPHELNVLKIINVSFFILSSINLYQDIKSLKLVVTLGLKEKIEDIKENEPCKLNEKEFETTPVKLPTEHIAASSTTLE